MGWFDNCSTLEEITNLYRSLAKKYHPDVSKEENADKIMKEINAEYDVAYSNIITNKFDITNISNAYKQRKNEPINLKLAFFMKDKTREKGYFSYIFNTYKLFFFGNSVAKKKVITDDSDTWDDFKGGFAIISTEYDYENDIYKAKRYKSIIPETPTYVDMYYWIHERNIESSEVTDIVEKNITMNSSVGFEWNLFKLIRTKFYNTWIEKEYMGKGKFATHAYMKVGNIIMSCIYPVNEKYYTVEDEVEGIEFSYAIFQECTKKEFCRTHDVDYTPKYSDGMQCELLRKESDLYWIHDPVVLHYARLGIVKFYQSKYSYKLRYGTFDSKVLEKNAHELDIESAEIIQDFLDELNDDFNNHIEGMIKSGKLKINI